MARGQGLARKRNLFVVARHEEALLRAKGGVSLNQGGKAHGIDVRCETALLLNRKGSLR